MQDCVLNKRALALEGSAGRAARALHDAGNHRTDERWCQSSACQHWLAEHAAYATRTRSYISQWDM